MMERDTPTPHAPSSVELCDRPYRADRDWGPPGRLFVLGMPRSGTSALTRVLSLCGGVLPAELVRADSNNPLGYWEPRATQSQRRNSARPRQQRRRPSLRLQEEGAFDAEEKAAALAGSGHISHVAGRAARGHQGSEDTFAVRHVV